MSVSIQVIRELHAWYLNLEDIQLQFDRGSKQILAYQQQDQDTRVALDKAQQDHNQLRLEGEQKELGLETFTKIPNGAPGVENRMSLIFNGGVVKGRMDLNRFVEVTSTAAAKAFGLFPKKGTIAVGTDADIVIFDPNRKETISVDNPCTHHMRVDYSAYEGFEVQGFTETVLSRGRVIIENNEQKIERGGQFLKRALVNSHLN